jgi:predicted DNA-binding protein (MmcQ/YjbR family)
MTLETLRDYCLGKPGTTESFPFGETTLVFKVGGKMFALMDIESRPLQVALKCDPERAIALREEHEAVQPGFHLNKTHWNTVTLDGTVKWQDLSDWIDHSYQLVLASLPKRVRAEIENVVSSL